MSDISAKSVVELRGIAQTLNISDIFNKDKAQLLQAISLKQDTYRQPPRIDIPRPTYDARLMTEEPNKMASRQEIEELCAPHVAKGLHLSFTDEQWQMKYGKRQDEGTMRMPLRIVLYCADKIMK